MRGALGSSGGGERRQVIYSSLEHDDEEQREAEQRRGKEGRSTTTHRDLVVALGAAVVLFLLALGGTYLHIQSEGNSTSDMSSTKAAETGSTSSLSPTADVASNNPTATLAQLASLVSAVGVSTAGTDRQTYSTGSTTSEDSCLLGLDPSGLAETGALTSASSKSSGHSATTETAPGSSSTSSTTSSRTETDSYWKKTYTGVGTHFPGASSPLACGDVYSSPSTTLFAALCHSLYDSPPGISDDEVENQNRNPVCEDFVTERKDLEGQWLTEESSDWVIVGGDGELNCVGTEEIRCHVPRTIAVTYNGKTVTGVLIVDRNQGFDPSPCDEGDVDLSDLAYLTLGETDVLSSGLKGVTWVWE